MTLYAFNRDTRAAYIYRFKGGKIYERAFHPFGGWDKETEYTSSTKEELILGLLEDGFILCIEKTYVFD